MTDLVVSEIFGPTVQGEGPYTGHPATFLRLMGCNLSCVWCDTPYTWDASRYDLKAEGTRMSVDDVLADIHARGDQMLVVSGGEPLLQQKALAELLEQVRDRAVHIETAGTVAPVGLDGCQFVVSPKLAHSGNPTDHAVVPGSIEALRDSGDVIAWKFVVQGVADLVEVDALVDRFGLEPVYIMPEGVDPLALSAVMRAVAPAVIERGFILTPRLHVELWGQERGH